jgi:hypothetical protein
MISAVVDSRTGETAVHYAAMVPDVRVLEALLEARGGEAAWVAMQARDSAGRTPLDLAAAAGLWGHVDAMHAVAARKGGALRGAEPDAARAGGSGESQRVSGTWILFSCRGFHWHFGCIRL